MSMIGGSKPALPSHIPHAHGVWGGIGQVTHAWRSWRETHLGNAKNLRWSKLKLAVERFSIYP